MVRHDEIENAITVALTCLKPYVKRETGLTLRSREELVSAIMRVLRPYVIVAPEMVSGEYRQGVFGVDEPHPFPDLVDEHGVPRIPGSRPSPAAAG